MKNITKTEIVLIILTIALIACIAVSLVQFFTNGVAINWLAITGDAAVITTSFSLAEKNKKEAKNK